MTEALHPYCNSCGWRKGGRDSWSGSACKCGHWEPPIGATMAEWRNTSDSLIEVGRAMSEIEQNFRHVRATAVVSDEQAIAYVQASYAAANRLVRALDRLRRSALFANG